MREPSKRSRSSLAGVALEPLLRWLLRGRHGCLRQGAWGSGVEGTWGSGVGMGAFVCANLVAKHIQTHRRLSQVVDGHTESEVDTKTSTQTFRHIHIFFRW